MSGPGGGPHSLEASVGQALGTRRTSHQQEHLSGSNEGPQWHQGAKSGKEARDASWNMENSDLIHQDKNFTVRVTIKAQNQTGQGIKALSNLLLRDLLEPFSQP